MIEYFNFVFNFNFNFNIVTSFSMRRVYTVLQIERLVDLNCEPSWNYKVRVSVTGQWEGRVTLKGQVFPRVREILTTYGEIIYFEEKKEENNVSLNNIHSKNRIVKSFDHSIDLL